MNDPLSNDGSKSPKPRKMRSFGTPSVEIMRLDFSKFGKPADPKPSEAQPIEGRTGKRGRIVKRLLAIIRDHRVSAQRVGFPLEQEDMGKILEALHVESFGGDPRPLVYHPDAIAAYLRESLFQELLEEPSNVLFTTQLDDETVRYEAMETAFWRECLEELAERVVGD